MATASSAVRNLPRERRNRRATSRGRAKRPVPVGLPFERTAERNLYRTSLTGFEQSVRDVQDLEDRVKLDVREDLRVLYEAHERVRIQARSVRLAEQRVESTSRFLDVGRAESRDVLEAQSDLVDAKNELSSELVRARLAELSLQGDLDLLQGLNRQLGIDLPNRPHRHEILSSEPLKPFLDPLVVDLSTGLYFSQSTRGELVTGISLPDAPDGSDESLTLHSSLRFLTHLSRTLTRLMPITAAMKVLRQWVGPYDVSPDGDAIVGPSPGHPDFIQVCGFTGHGFMMAPAVGRLLARWLLDGEAHPMLARWSPGRFAAGGVARREDMIIG